MNVLIVAEYYPPRVQGGGEINVALTAAALIKAGVSVSVLTSWFPGLAEAEVIDGVQIYRRTKTGSSPRHMLDNLKREWIYPQSVVHEVRRLCLSFPSGRGYDIIHFQGNSILAAEQVQSLGIPLVAIIESYPAFCPKGDRLYAGRSACMLTCTIRHFLPCQLHSRDIGKMINAWYLKYNPFWLWFAYRHYRKTRRSLQYCHLLAISAYVQQLLQRHHFPCLGIVPNVIPLASVMEDAPKRGTTNVDAPKDTSADYLPTVLYLGAFTEAKGPHILMEALDGLSCRGEFYGEGPLAQQLQAMISSRQIQARLHNPVLSQETNALYSRADVVVIPSIWPEPFGRIPLEALSIGTRVIASAVGGITETMEGRELVPPGDVEALRNAIRRVLAQGKKTSLLPEKIIPTGPSSFSLSSISSTELKKYSAETVARTLLGYYHKATRAGGIKSSYWCSQNDRIEE